MSVQYGYGFFCGGDPRKFFPDGELCSQAEIDNHSAACKLWDEAEAPGETPTPEECPSGWITSKIHVLRAPYGIGTYEYDDGEPEPEPELTETGIGFGASDADLSEWKKDRREALLSLDKDKIQSYMKKYGAEINTKSLSVFWAAIHKAITGATDLPLEFRKQSKAWLSKRGLSSFDDGELSESMS